MTDYNKLFRDMIDMHLQDHQSKANAEEVIYQFFDLAISYMIKGDNNAAKELLDNIFPVAIPLINELYYAPEMEYMNYLACKKFTGKTISIVENNSEKQLTVSLEQFNIFRNAFPALNDLEHVYSRFGYFPNLHDFYSHQSFATVEKIKLALDCGKPLNDIPGSMLNKDYVLEHYKPNLTTTLMQMIVNNEAYLPFVDMTAPSRLFNQVLKECVANNKLRRVGKIELSKAIFPDFEEFTHKKTHKRVKAIQGAKTIREVVDPYQATLSSCAEIEEKLPANPTLSQFTAFVSYKHDLYIVINETISAIEKLISRNLDVLMKDRKARVAFIKAIPTSLFSDHILEDASIDNLAELLLQELRFSLNINLSTGITLKVLPLICGPEILKAVALKQPELPLLDFIVKQDTLMQASRTLLTSQRIELAAKVLCAISTNNKGYTPKREVFKQSEYVSDSEAIKLLDAYSKEMAKTLDAQVVSTSDISSSADMSFISGPKL